MLASPQNLVRGQVANVISAIAAIEIPRKEWQSLVPNLCINAENQEYNIRLASLQTLGYICEEINPQDLDSNTMNQVVIALSNNAGCSQKQEDLEPCRLASKALIYAIPYMSQNFKVQNERDYIMKKFFEMCQQQNDEILENALICIREITTQNMRVWGFISSKFAK